MKCVYSVFPNTAAKNKTPLYKKYTRILSKQPAFKKLIALTGPLGYKIPIWPSINDAILYAVIGQMLSRSAAVSIINGLHKDLGSSRNILQWAQRNYRKKKAIKGVSQRKRKALKEWFVYSNNNNGRWKDWVCMPLNEYREEICSIWGFGRWSADMIAIFHLGRMDIWPETDNGIQKSSKLIFGSNKYAEIKNFISGCETIVALYLWESINRKVLHYFERN